MKLAALGLVLVLLSIPTKADTVQTAVITLDDTLGSVPIDLTLISGPDIENPHNSEWCLALANNPTVRDCSAFFSFAYLGLEYYSGLTLTEPAGFTLPFNDLTPISDAVPEPPTALLIISGMLVLGICYCFTMMMSSKRRFHGVGAP